MIRTPGILACVLVAALAGPGPAAEEDFARVLKSGEVKERLEAVKQLAEGSRPDAEDLLLVAVGDRDWEVAEKACEALAKKGGEKSVRPLAEISFGGPVRRLRLAAAAALGVFAPEAGSKLVQGALAARDDATAAAAAEALAEMRHPSSKEKLKAALANKSPYARREAAQALGSLRDPSLLRDLEAVLLDPDLMVRAGAVEGIARIGDPRATASLLTEIQTRPPAPKLSDMVERRIVSAIRRILHGRKGTEEAEAGVRKVVDALRNEKDGVVAARICRILGSLARSAPEGSEGAGSVPAVSGGDAKPEETKPDDAKAGEPKPAAPPKSGPGLLEGEGPVSDPAPVVKVLAEVGLQHKDPVCRRAAAAALGRIGGEDALAPLKSAISADADEFVRFHALRAYRRWKSAKDEAAFQAFHNVLQYDKSPLVREEAAVALGVKGLEGAVETLSKATRDAAWEVAVAAAVSLGKTRDPKAVEALTPLLAAKDWKIRGAGAAGIGWANQVAGIPVLIPMLSDPEVSVSRTAWEFLKRLTDKNLPLSRTEWDSWWAEKGKGFVIVDREAEARDARKYGYALKDRDVYEDLDVVVLKSRGDSIQSLLGTLEIRHRLTQSANVRKDGVQPFGVFVSNCTGEMQPDDHLRVQWFVHAGGALFGSCWAVDTTVGEEFPGTMRRWKGFPGQVVDKVRAEELPTESEYLGGVFPGLVRPIYELYGAYLIEVLDPERLEVLIDSPETASKFAGCGNLAAWFTAGHGVVMGSSNHFDRQTMTTLKDAWGVSVRNESERRAFAVDHFGFAWDRVRELDQKGVFAKQSETEKEVTDQSAFRFLTNFVRRKRIVDL